MTARIRTTHDEIVIQGNYGSKWEDVSFEETMPEARQTLRDYRENEPQYRHRLIVRRVPNVTNNDAKTDQRIVSMAEIKSYSRGHWFDASTTRLFRSRYPRTGIRKGNLGYFITSEQFVGSSQIPDKRKYTIRALNYTTGDIDTIGEFNVMTKSQAQTELRRILNTN